MFKIGDMVVRKSYNSDILFTVCGYRRQGKNVIYRIKGACVRIEADASEDDLMPVEKTRKEQFTKHYDDIVERIKLQIKKERNSNTGFRSFGSEGDILKRPGRVLHLDGDIDYLKECLSIYRELNIDVVGVEVREEKQPDVVLELLNRYKPDILVITGHDAMKKGAVDRLDLSNYKNSAYFVQAVKKAREYEPSLDDLAIIAGACQSCYEELMEAGANYASSPQRVLIHCLDPVFICEKIAYTKINDIINASDVLERTISGKEGMGGLNTRGKYREGLPNYSKRVN
ncbi:sporulation peptidase YabG [Calorimonas adulescens]|uniref:Sporulation peptidase YabG n=1 Tax=Calorimonas adulescens TaxID=2606906 RepID=A0A5D8QEN3_9THEO|nr:sporulation peptidase YabG [Calorimonas adulescens]TZE82867.1 sporulation peptidase YabG [Calorimonas adulescens]